MSVNEIGLSQESVQQNLAIRLTDVSVKYSVPLEPVFTLKERIIRTLRGQRNDSKEFWALRGLTLDVLSGETLGLLGRNGAGKSTLLKVIARIITPTSGRVISYGRVAPLIELGAGFHPELTGRENIYLNGAILGSTRDEIDRNYDKIVEFAELAPFINAPIRTYSSGMVVRLGFAVAVHTDPDILIVDEVLSVGDLSFQKKCMRKIQEFRETGKTILFVSHSPEKASEICDRAVWIKDGQMHCSGQVDEVLELYKRSTTQQPVLWTGADFAERSQPKPTGEKQEAIFVDVPTELPSEMRWLTPWIEQCYKLGITNGCSTEPLRYCPMRHITRASIAVMVLRARHWPNAIEASKRLNIFSDVNNMLPAWMAPWIDKFHDEGFAVIDNEEPQLYQPHRSLTRAELAVILLKAKHGSDFEPFAPQVIFEDVPRLLPEQWHWMAPWIQQAYDEGIIDAWSKDPMQYGPLEHITRAEISNFLIKAFGLPNPGDEVSRSTVVG